MNLSLAPVAEVPPEVVTVTSTVPVPDGELTVRVVELVTLTEVPAVGAEDDHGRATPDEAVAGDRDRGASGLGAAGRVDIGRPSAGRCVNLSLRAGRRGAVGGGHRDVDRPGPRRCVDREGGRIRHVDRGAHGRAEEDRCRAPTPETNPLPVTVTGVPPAWGPLVGLTLVTVGGVGAV